MQQDLEHIALVRQVMAGDAGSLSALAEVAQARVCAYVRRVVLNDERAQDLTQETMVAMLSSRDQLRDPLRFWPWLFTIANNKIRHFYRRAELHPKPFSDRDPADPDGELGGPDPHSRELGPAEGLARSELVEITRSALAELDVRHRMVLAMRFYEDLPHSAISDVLGCTEMNARVTFLRAKRALVRALQKRGIRDAALAFALIAFGEATRPAAAAGAVQLSASALRESTRYFLLAKGGIPATAALLVFALLLVWAGKAPADRPADPPVGLSVHYTEQSQVAQCAMDFNNTRSQGAFEQWLRFPDGAAGPVLSRVQLWDPFLKEKMCWWVENEQANYHVQRGGPITIRNTRLYGQRVKTLPTDPADFVDFIHQVQAAADQPATAPADLLERDAKSGFLSKKTDYRFPELGPFETRYDYTPLPQSLFEPPGNVKLIDERDEMHFRGWTWFRVTGTLGGRRVTGTGRMPFSYAAYRTHRPWLRLQVEGGCEFADTPGGAWIACGDRTTRRADLGPEAFFNGLPRPWFGLHTLDVIRRDAARHRIWFETQNVPADSAYIVVTLIDREQTPALRAAYRIDTQRDLLTEVTFSMEGVEAAVPDRLEFEYVQNIEVLDREYSAPARPASTAADASTPDPGPLWPHLLDKQFAPAPQLN